MTALLLAAIVASQPQSGFKPIFDGKTFNGWNCSDMSHWSIRDQAITGTISPEQPLNQNLYMVWHEPMADFELKLKFRFSGSPGTNGGFQFRSRLLPGGDMAGYQMDNNRDTSWQARLYEEHGRETLAFRGSKATIASDGTLSLTPLAGADGPAWFALDQWHEYHLICHGPHLILRVDGRLAAEVVDGDTTKRALSGLLGLQLHTGPPMVVQFKEIGLKTLKPGSKADPKWLATGSTRAARPRRTDKTLVAWVKLANLTQRGGSALTLQQGTVFDGLVFGESEPAKWILGSDFWSRTQKDTYASPRETASPNEFVQIAAVSKGSEVTLYRNGTLHSRYVTLPSDLIARPEHFAVFGLRHLGSTSGETLQGEIDDARIYDRALSQAEISQLKANEPSAIRPLAWWTFERTAPTDRAGRFGVNELSNGARIEDGKLILDKPGATLVAKRK